MSEPTLLSSEKPRKKKEKAGLLQEINQEFEWKRSKDSNEKVLADWADRENHTVSLDKAQSTTHFQLLPSDRHRQICYFFII